MKGGADPLRSRPLSIYSDRPSPDKESQFKDSG